MGNANQIRVRGARENNLKNIAVDVPKGSWVLVCGPSGSGKSSLAFDTIYAEAQRRFVENLSVSVRRAIDHLPRPSVDSIDGLIPAIALGQDLGRASSRSTVGTLSEVHYALALLYSRIGIPWCEKFDREIRTLEPDDMAARLEEMPEGTKIQILAPITSSEPGNTVLSTLLEQGYPRVRVNGDIRLIDEDEVNLVEDKQHIIEVVVDRIKLRPDIRTRLIDSLEAALRLSGGSVRILSEYPDGEIEEFTLSERFVCETCDLIFSSLKQQDFSFFSSEGACSLCEGSGLAGEDGETCPACKGERLKPQSRSVRVAGRRFPEIMNESIETLVEWFDKFPVNDYPGEMVAAVLSEIKTRLGSLNSLGLGYLSLGRSLATLSGGEAQRVRLSAQLSSSLSGVLYVLDEPSLGLHPFDIEKLIKAFRSLLDNGNSLLLVEHERKLIESADTIIEIGPGAGELGGHLVSQGSLKHIRADKDSPTGAYLRGEIEFPVPAKRTSGAEELELRNVETHNLKDISVKIPLGTFTCVTGVSGAGKSSLVMDTLVPLLGDKKASAELSGAEEVSRLIAVNQAPIGRSARSTPATFLGIFDPIRELFSQLPEAKKRGYGPSRFSFNAKGGRCESCQGLGTVCVEMDFLPDVFVECEKCAGLRYNSETLSVRFKGFSISDVLDFSVAEALKVFEAFPKVYMKLELLVDVGLDYLRLGQASYTLSGGEAQRVRLATELGKRKQQGTLYVLDEPTSGLHPVDVKKLLDTLHRLVEAENTVLVVEHDPDVISSADWIIDLGPGAGDKGGNLVYQGELEGLMKSSDSLTAQYLRDGK